MHDYTLTLAEAIEKINDGYLVVSVNKWNDCWSYYMKDVSGAIVVRYHTECGGWTDWHKIGEVGYEFDEDEISGRSKFRVDCKVGLNNKVL